MGKLRKKHNWKGRQQNDSQKPADDNKTDVVVELEGNNLCYTYIHLVLFAPLLFAWFLTLWM